MFVTLMSCLKANGTIVFSESLNFFSSLPHSVENVFSGTGSDCIKKILDRAV